MCKLIGRMIVTVALLIATCTLTNRVSFADSPSFRRDVMPVFFRAGCNSGTCHGSARGKDGFMLSLFGFDAKGDYERVVTEMYGRRVNLSVPENSLLLLKATGSVPHTGGKLFDKESPYYRILADWIQAGAPDDRENVPETTSVHVSFNSVAFRSAGETRAMRVTAKSSDGTERDVTSLARFFSNDTSVATIDADGQIVAVGPGDTHVFARFNRFTVGVETIVLPSESGFIWPDFEERNYIDSLVFQRLRLLRMTPSPLCDDETFLRRITLDLAGRPPTVEEFHSFMEDESPRKRATKIDELLASDAFADLWTALWAEQLRIIGGNYAPVATDVKAADSFYRWINKQMRQGTPLNTMVGEMVEASGSNLNNGPVNLYTMLVHKPQFEPKAFAADFSQLFLGVQIQCAECHNHPFDRWTMDDYYGFVSFFTGMKRKPGVEPRERRIYCDVDAPPAKHLVDGRPMPARALGASVTVESGKDPRIELAKWLTSKDNRLFSRNQSNRVWAQLIGRGVIEPVDDVRASNPPSNAPLLDALDQHLVESNYDLRTLVRDICNSHVYQSSVTPNDSNRKDIRQFSHAHLKRLRADVLLDSVVSVTGVPRNFPGFPEGTRALEYYPRLSGDTEGPNFGDPFFATFGRSSRGSVCACETKKDPTLSQTLHMIVGDSVRDRLFAGGAIARMVSEENSPEIVLDKLFVRTLSRHPTADERSSLLELIRGSEKDISVYEDIFWGLLNSTEFAFNH